MIIMLSAPFSGCCELLDIKGDKSPAFGKYKLANVTQTSDVLYQRITDNKTFILSKSSGLGWKVRLY